MSRAIDAGAAGAPRELAGARSSYFQHSELPLTSLIFLLPMIICYEVGTQFFTTAARHGKNNQIIAFTKMHEFFQLCRAPGRHLPAMAVVVVLLAWHIARRERWTVQWGVLLGMAGECAALTAPLILLDRLRAFYLPLAALTSSTTDSLIMSCGAGVYEEFVFRLSLFALLSLLLHDVWRMQRGYAHLLIVAVSAISFSAYHYLSPSEHFQWQTFAFRTLAGGYFGVLFVIRGFGITAGCHCFYDILILAC